LHPAFSPEPAAERGALEALRGQPPSLSAGIPGRLAARSLRVRVRVPEGPAPPTEDRRPSQRSNEIVATALHGVAQGEPLGDASGDRRGQGAPGAVTRARHDPRAGEAVLLTIDGSEQVRHLLLAAR